MIGVMFWMSREREEDSEIREEAEKLQGERRRRVLIWMAVSALREEIFQYWFSTDIMYGTLESYKSFYSNVIVNNNLDLYTILHIFFYHWNANDVKLRIYVKNTFQTKNKQEIKNI